MIKICKLIKLTTCFVLFLIATGAFGQSEFKITISDGTSEVRQVTANTNFSVIVEAINSTTRAVDASVGLQVGLVVSAGTLTSSSSASLEPNLMSGTFTWDDLKIDALGEDITITVREVTSSAPTFLSVESAEFDVVANELSFITRVSGGETASIDYSMHQGASNLLEGTSTSLFTFKITDVGTDGLPTILNNITFLLENHTNLRVLALFHGSTFLAELNVPAAIELNGGEYYLSFEDLGFEVESDDNEDVNVRGYFLRRCR